MLRLEHFLLMFPPRQQEQQEQQSFFKDLWAELAVKNLIFQKRDDSGVIYIADDDNSYDIRLFEEV